MPWEVTLQLLTVNLKLYLTLTWLLMKISIKNHFGSKFHIINIFSLCYPLGYLSYLAYIKMSYFLLLTVLCFDKLITNCV